MSGQADPTLTKPQRRELEELAGNRRERGGRVRARIQNTLVDLGLAVLVDDGFLCEITAAGRTRLSVKP